MLGLEGGRAEMVGRDLQRAFQRGKGVVTDGQHLQCFTFELR